jgi:8-oxo-dGTP pyrophosphatase MutT (NUDIX family)
MHSPYPIQTISTPEKGARISFSDTFEIIEDELKMTPMSFCFLGDKIVLSFDKTREWNAQCGHRNEGESVEACLKREAFEEAGVAIDIISEFGRMKYETDYNTKKQYPSVTYIPVYVAKVISLENLPKGSEVHKVIVADHEETVALLSARDDNKLLLSIYEACREFYFVKMAQARAATHESI